MTGFQMNNKKQAGSLAVVPRHIAIIMDGNNRWARKRLMPGVAGHKAGVDAVRAMIEVTTASPVKIVVFSDASAISRPIRIPSVT